MPRFLVTALLCAACGLPSLARAQAFCESPAPERFDSRVFGDGGATVFDVAAQYQARRAGRAGAGESVYVGSGAPYAAGFTPADLLQGLTAAAGVAAAIQGRNSAAQAGVGAGRPRCRSPEVACDTRGGCPGYDSLPLCKN